MAKIVELTITCGVTADSASGMAWYGVMIADFEGRYRDGLTYVHAGLALIDRHGFEGQRTGVLLALDQVAPWTRTFGYAIEGVHAAIVAGHAAGDLAMTCYARNHLVSDLLQMGRPLAEVEAEADRGLGLTRRIHFRDIELLISAQRGLARQLRTGEASEPYETVGEIASASSRFWVRLYAGMTAYFFDDMDRASRALAEADLLRWSLPAHIDVVYHHLFAALTAARRLPPEEALAAMAPYRARFAGWTDLNAPTFLHKWLLLEAEAARLAGDGLAALRHFDRAIGAAGSFVHERALARELAGRHCMEQGLEGLARLHMREAARDYRLWGADAKARRLPWQDGEDGEDPAERDLRAAMDTIRAITRTADPETLRSDVLRAFMTHVGARRGKLLLIHDGDPVIEAEGERGDAGIAIVVETRMPTPDRVAPELLQAVLGTGEPVVKDVPPPHAAQGGGSPDTLVGLPLRGADGLAGILCLEVDPGRFARQGRMATLVPLAEQAAIALDRARSQADAARSYAFRAQTENALRAARAELAHRSHLATLGGLAASIAHDINQPLSTIVAYASAGRRWLRRPEPDLGEALQSLEAIEAAGLRAAEIVAALRSLAKQDTGQREILDLNEVIRGVLDLTEPDRAAHQLRLVVHLADRPMLVSADRVQLQQLVVNLVNNGIDAMAEAAADDRVLTVSTVERDGGFLALIEDRGCGIPPDAMARIFEPLFSTKAKGIGMGLAICRSVIEAHRGTLRVEPREEAGRASRSRFRRPTTSRRCPRPGVTPSGPDRRAMAIRSPAISGPAR